MALVAVRRFITLVAVGIYCVTLSRVSWSWLLIAELSFLVTKKPCMVQRIDRCNTCLALSADNSRYTIDHTLCTSFLHILRSALPQTFL